MTVIMPVYLIPAWFLALSGAERQAVRAYLDQRRGRLRPVESAS
jgi:predicted LPLAT superfamily acyltransferase